LVGPHSTPLRRERGLWPIFAVALFLPGLQGCEPPPPPSDPELRQELGIDDSVPIHQILLSGRGDRTRVLPAHLQIRSGDVVQFRVMDGRVHRVRFVTEELSSESRAFIEETGQTAPPPLVERDARLVLTFVGAPAGNYPFVVEGFGDPVVGGIRVVED
jgi:plastocyanin